MAAESQKFAPGMRIVVRDAEWMVRKADNAQGGGILLSCVGISELVRDKEAQFLDILENQYGRGIEVLDPKKTKLVEDDSPGFLNSRLYIESMIRSRVPVDENIHLGDKAAMDSMNFQLLPTKMALKQPRPRILIADAVGLGKTLEAGILVSELMRRGKGKRILVLTVKSMLTQFQKEFWSRFSIPLTRLDSTGLAQVRSKIPTNHNPFNYFDKSIVSIDTLKQSQEYSHYLEKAYWDIIIIDEAHNVAERGGSQQSHSARSKLAKLLSTRSDALIMLSATPHDGKAESFASLMNMLDATAIANPSNYTHEDFKDKNLIVRRFQKDVREEIAGEFPPREIKSLSKTASQEEEAAFARLVDLKLVCSDNGRKSSHLFKVSLEKALFSSPHACLSVVQNRIKNLSSRQNSSEFIQDINELESFKLSLEHIINTSSAFSKYNNLVETIRDDLAWKKNGPSDDRLVIFTESIKTLDYLFESLKADLKLNDKQIKKMHGSMADTDIMQVVEEFGQEGAPVRVLVCSDVASEGINLHHQSHKMIHFDVPWSLMTFQQRNGRINRYGQTKQPQIRYLLTDSDNDQIKGDMRTLELLIEKDQQTVENIGDSAEFTKSYDSEEEVELVSQAMLITNGTEKLNAQFEDNLQAETSDDDEFDMTAFLADLNFNSDEDDLTQNQTSVSDVSFFNDDYDYAKSCLTFLKSKDSNFTFEEDKQLISLYAPQDLRRRFEFLPKEVRPAKDTQYRLHLSQDKTLINQEFKRAQSDSVAWPKVSYLWPVHPVSSWLNDKVKNAFGRHEAPVLRLIGKLDPQEDYFILSGMYPNRRSYPVANPWIVVKFNKGLLTGIEIFEDFIKKARLNELDLSNQGSQGDASYQQGLLPLAIDAAKPHMEARRQEIANSLAEKLHAQTASLEALKSKHIEQIEFDFSKSKLHETRAQNERETRTRQVNRLFETHQMWIKETLETQDTPYIQLIAVLTGTRG